MGLLFRQTDTASTSGTPAACSGRSAATTTSSRLCQQEGLQAAGTGTQTVTLPSSTSNVWGIYHECPLPLGALQPVFGGPAATFTWNFNVTTANMNITLTEVYVCLWKNSVWNTMGSSTGLSVSMGSTGVKSGNVTLTQFYEQPLQGEYLGFVFVFSNGAMSSQSIVYTIGQAHQSPFILRSRHTSAGHPFII